MNDVGTQKGLTTKGQTLAVECMAPLRKLSDSGGDVWPIDIHYLQVIVGHYLDSIIQAKEASRLRANIPPIGPEETIEIDEDGVVRSLGRSKSEKQTP